MFRRLTSGPASCRTISPVDHARQSSSGFSVVVGGAVDSEGGGSDVVAVGSVGSVVTLGAGVVSTTRAARPVVGSGQVCAGGASVWASPSA